VLRVRRGRERGDEQHAPGQQETADREGDEPGAPQQDLVRPDRLNRQDGLNPMARRVDGRERLRLHGPILESQRKFCK
jgi:hypothetical protein